MSDIKLSGQRASEAQRTMGLYVCPNDPEGLNSLYYTVEVNDAQGVAFLRRLLTADVKNIHRGEVRQSFILNALGLITDFVWVAHLPDSDDHYRVVFQSLDTLAWMHQVAKAFDEDFTTLNVSSALLFAEQTDSPHGMMADGKVQTIKTAKGEVLVMRVGKVSLVQGEKEAFTNFTHPGITVLDDLAAMTLVYASAHPLCFAWEMQDLMPSDVNGADFIDFSDPARMFIGRALTEARLKAAEHKKAVVVSSHQDNAVQWFDDPKKVTLLNAEAELVSQTQFVGLLGDKLIACAFVPEHIDPQSLLWVNDGEDSAYRVEVIG